MNVRTVEIPQTPTASTSVVYNRISMPCAPWEQPDHAQLSKPGRTIISASSLEARIMAGLQAGLTRQRDILGGRLSGPLEDKARLIFNQLLESGRATRTRDRDGFIWRLTEND